MSELSDLVSKGGIGLNRLIRYAYAGFLFAFFMALFKPGLTASNIKTMTPGLAAITILMIGIGFYIAHRTVIIPLSHLLLIGIFAFAYRNKNIKICPTAILNHYYTIPRGRRMLAYSILRRSSFFKNKEQLDVAHAEGGILVITFTACLLASGYVKYVECKEPQADLPGNWIIYLVISLVSLLASLIWGWIQHAAEGLIMLEEHGKPDEPTPTQPPAPQLDAEVELPSDQQQGTHLQVHLNLQSPEQQDYDKLLEILNNAGFSPSKQSIENSED